MDEIINKLQIADKKNHMEKPAFQPIIIDKIKGACQFCKGITVNVTKIEKGEGNE